jgi:hypothetical protein
VKHRRNTEEITKGMDNTERERAVLACVWLDSMKEKIKTTGQKKIRGECVPTTGG